MGGIEMRADVRLSFKQVGGKCAQCVARHRSRWTAAILIEA